jgi:SNF2 family DNA or RNA helicase
MRLYKYRGFIYVEDSIKDFEWLSYPTTGNPYFILNHHTRFKFKEDILPLIKSKQAQIDIDLYNEIRYYTGNLVNNNPKPIVNLPGITYKDHQKTALEFMQTFKKFGFFLGPGSGKTIIAIAFLLSFNIKSALIVTPQKVISQYQSELDKYIPGNKYIVTNYEQLHKYISFGFEAFILDESHKVKSYSSKANEYCRAIAKNCEYTYLFTGTPQDKSRHEILAQLAILDERVMPSKTKTLARYFNFDDYFQPSTEKKEFSDELSIVIEDYTWGKKTEEVVQLMEEKHTIISCVKPPIYDTLAKDRILRINVLDKQESVRCVADNKGVLKVKLRELCNGHLICEDSNKEAFHINIDCHKEYRLQEYVQFGIPKGIIYYEFDWDIFFIDNALKKAGKTFRLLNGKTPKKEIESILEDFKTNKCDFLVMQSKSGNAGLDLTNTNNVIFYSLPESYIVFTQCKARINRIGQTKECNYYYLICKDSVEEQIYATINKKKNFSTRLFKIYN